MGGFNVLNESFRNCYKGIKRNCAFYTARERERAVKVARKVFKNSLIKL